MARIALVQPAPGARISGGYLYNARMAEHGAFTLVDVDPARLPAAVAGLAADLVLADSIWLSEESFAPFLARAEAGGATGVLMHSFPSMIAAAEGGGAIRTRPTDFEVAALERVGLMVTPGPHYVDMLRDRALSSLVCEPGIDDALRAPPRERTGPCTLVSVGAVTRRKGFLDVLEALAPRARDPGFRWVVIGSLTADPDYASAFAERARDFPGVRLAGQLTPDAVRAELAAAHVLVMPSYDENHPLVLLEALAGSLPSVAYAAGAAARIVEHGREGFVVPIGDVAGMGRHLAQLIDDEPLRRSLAEGAWQRQRALPNWRDAAASAYATFTRHLAG